MASNWPPALLGSAARAIRSKSVRDAFTTNAQQSIGDAFDRLQPDARERMFANAEVFFDLEIPALVEYRPEPAAAERALKRIDIPLCVTADANNPAAPPVRAARRLAEVLGVELHHLPGGHMPYATNPETTAAIIRAAVGSKTGGDA